MKKSFLLSVIFFCLVPFFCFSQTTSDDGVGSQEVIYTPRQQELRITAEDVRIVREPDASKGGYHLYIRKLPNIQSVLLTETTKDPSGKNANYAYRTKDYNPINGDEIRLLDGKPLTSPNTRYSLIDSTVENTEFFGEAFHIYIPETLYYGYPWTRNGEILLSRGTFINIRSFSKPYADYSGDFMDNPFRFDLRTVKKPIPLEPEEETILTDIYNPVASIKFKELSEEIIHSKGPETIVEDIINVLEKVKDKKPLDLVFAIDATSSMKEDLARIKADLQKALQQLLGEAPDVQLGLLFYRDYGDNFKDMNLPVKIFDFTKDYQTFTKNLHSVKIYGNEGGDIPEAVYEALFAASTYYAWRENSERQVILIGDAEPHPRPRGTKLYTEEYVMTAAAEKNVHIKAILLPTKSKKK